MSTLVITISIDIPDGVAVSVGSGAAGSGSAAPALPSVAPRNDAEPPFPTEAPGDMTRAATNVFDGMGDLVSEPSSVLHDTHVATPVQPPGTHHGQPWKYVPAGVSKKTSLPYSGFWACQDRDCKAKP